MLDLQEALQNITITYTLVPVKALLEVLTMILSEKLLFYCVFDLHCEVQMQLLG